MLDGAASRSTRFTNKHARAEAVLKCLHPMQIITLGAACLVLLLLTWYVSVTSWPDSLSCLTSSWLRPTSSGFNFLRMLYKM